MRRVIGSIGFASALVAIVSCEAIVSDTIPQFTCSGGSAKACPANQYCKGSGCSACESSDVCDHFDNDCNGVIDDGPLSDADGDGFSVCGVLDAKGATSSVDCNDNDPNIFPGSGTRPKPDEVCDSVDNDCDGIVDNAESLTLCPAGLTCAPSGKCVNTDCRKTPCVDPDKCDALSLACIKPASKAIGDVCATDGECQAGLLCANLTQLGVNVAQGAGICTRPCCQSGDCGDPGFVCYGPGLGGNYCVKTTLLARSATGRKGPGEAAGSASECRSGILEGNKCTDTCCSDEQCPGQACTLGQLSGHTVFRCSATFGAAASGESISSGKCASHQNASCRSGACNTLSCKAPFGWFACDDCVSPCCGSAACGDLEGKPSACWNERIGNDFVSMCSAVVPGGSGATGAPCTVNADCRSNRCYSDPDPIKGRYCTDVCCTNSDCGSKAGPMTCKPVLVATPSAYFLRCVKS